MSLEAEVNIGMNTFRKRKARRRMPINSKPAAIAANLVKQNKY